METRAHHFVIGIFAIGVAVLGMLFAIWIGRYEFDVRYADFDIYFEGTVSGLDVGADVRYNGIKVGQVEDVRLDKVNQDRVRVRVSVDLEKARITDNTVATIDTQLLTGLAIVQLKGGLATEPELQAKAGEPVAVIRSEKTVLQQLYTDAPRLIAQGNEILGRINEMLSGENVEYVSQIVRDIKTVADQFAASSGDVGIVLANARDISTDIKNATARLDEIAANVERVTASADTLISKDARELAEKLKALTSQVEALVRENRPALRDFARGGLPQFVLFIQEARELFASLDRVVAKIESDPGAFLFGRGAAEYSPVAR